ncbi:MAG: hypothetical protein ABJF88_18480 [Rhodothermales bacterium]
MHDLQALPDGNDRDLATALLRAIREQSRPRSVEFDEAGARAAFNAEPAGLLWELEKMDELDRRRAIERDALLKRIVDADGFDADNAGVYVETYAKVLDRRAVVLANAPSTDDGENFDNHHPLSSRDRWAHYAAAKMLRWAGLDGTAPARVLKLELDCADFREMYFDAFDGGLAGWARRITDGDEEPAGLYLAFLIRKYRRLGRLIQNLIDGFPPN